VRNRLLTLSAVVALALVAGIALAQEGQDDQTEDGATEESGEVKGLPPFLEEGAELPPGLAKKEVLPPGLAKKLNDNTPPGQAKKDGDWMPPGLAKKDGDWMPPGWAKKGKVPPGHAPRSGVDPQG
jgi:hypothetical protein